MTSFLFTRKSVNQKTGPIPVTTTSNDTCPKTCPFKGNGCYAEQGPLGGLWRNLSATEPGQSFKNGRSDIQAKSWDELLDNVQSLPEGTLWRHNQAGDLPGDGNSIDIVALAQLTTANKGKKGFTYTHHAMTGQNLEAVRAANAAGFTINASANGPRHADTLADLGLPVVTVLPEHATTNLTTPKGRKVVVCPAITRDDVTCQTCGLCQRQDRSIIIGFPAHGAAKRKADSIAKE